MTRRAALLALAERCNRCFRGRWEHVGYSQFPEPHGKPVFRCGDCGAEHTQGVSGGDLRHIVNPALRALAAQEDGK